MYERRNLWGKGNKTKFYTSATDECAKQSMKKKASRE